MEGKTMSTFLKWSLYSVICLALVYVATYFANAYRELWHEGSWGALSLGTLGMAVLVFVPILLLLTYIEMVVVVPTPVDVLRNSTLIWLLLGVLHGMIVRPFSVYGAFPFDWLTWWSLIQVLGLAIFVISLIDLPASLRHQAEADRRREEYWEKMQSRT